MFCLFWGFSSHSHIVMQCHPILASSFWTFLSRAMLRLILFVQNSVFVFGIT